tara:strand:+ start:71 stop:334 length:264 start_codon:yes stop_codon:yes gene_type:complete
MKKDIVYLLIISGFLAFMYFQYTQYREDLSKVVFECVKDKQGNCVKGEIEYLDPCESDVITKTMELETCNKALKSIERNKPTKDLSK